MTAWIVLLGLVTLFTLAVWFGAGSEPPLPPPGYERERQLAELRALTAAMTHGMLPR